MDSEAQLREAKELLRDLTIEVCGAFFVNEKPIRIAIGNKHYDELMAHVARAKEFLKPKVV